MACSPLFSLLSRYGALGPLLASCDQREVKPSALRLKCMHVRCQKWVAIGHDFSCDRRRLTGVPNVSAEYSSPLTNSSIKNLAAIGRAVICSRTSLRNQTSESTGIVPTIATKTWPIYFSIDICKMHFKEFKKPACLAFPSSFSQAVTSESKTSRGNAPFARTSSWKARRSNLAPSRFRASSRSFRISS